MKTSRGPIRYLTTLVLFWMLLIPAGSAAAQTQPDIASIEVSQVDNTNFPEITIYVRVLDSTGSPVTGLLQESFSVTEDANAVDITSFSGSNTDSISTILVLDHSGSMDEQGKLVAAKDAANAFVDLMRTQDRAAVMAFDEEVVNLQTFTSDTNAIRYAINLIQPDGYTALFDAVYQAAKTIESQTGRKSIILLSDGLDNSSMHTAFEAMDAAVASGAPVYAIALGTDIDRNTLTTLADRTGGEYYETPSASELRDLYTNLSIATQNEYVITYRTPRPTNDGTRRDIHVSITINGVDYGGGGTVYSESHLVNIQSSIWVALACILPLGLAVVVPLGIQLLTRKKTPAIQSPAGMAPPPPPPPPAYVPPVELPPVGAPIASVSTAAATTCPNCHAPLRAGAKFCAACGQAVGSLSPTVAAQPAQGTNCQFCNAPLKPGARFCPKCGRQQV